jgi:hypothetical protein
MRRPRLAGLCFVLAGCGGRSGLDGAPAGAFSQDAALPMHADGGRDQGRDAGLLTPYSCAYGGQPGAPWPMAGRCPDHRGYIPVTATATTAHIRWTYATADSFLAAPVIGADGTLYLGTKSGALLAVTSAGTLAWSTPLGTAIAASAAIAANDEIYVVAVSAGEATLFAVSLAGVVLWKQPVAPTGGSGPYVSAPTPGPEGNVYISSGPGLQAFSSTGSLLWHFAALGNQYPPAVGADGTVYYTPMKESTNTPTFIALDSSGQMKWQVDLSTFTAVGGGVSLGPDGAVYGCGQGGGPQDNVYAVGPGGSMLWTTEVSADGWGCASTPVVGPDGILFALNDQLVSFAPDGTQGWSVDLPFGAASRSPAMAGDGAQTLYMGTTNPVATEDFVQSVTGTGAAGWTYQATGFPTSPAIGADGTVYVASDDGKLIAFGP